MHIGNYIAFCFLMNHYQTLWRSRIATSVVEMSIFDYRTRRLRLKWCRIRESRTNKEWQRSMLNDESCFCLGADDYCIDIWRKSGQRFHWLAKKIIVHFLPHSSFWIRAFVTCTSLHKSTHVNAMWSRQWDDSVNALTYLLFTIGTSNITPDVIWGAILYSSQSLLVEIRGSLITERYVQ